MGEWVGVRERKMVHLCFHSRAAMSHPDMAGNTRHHALCHLPPRAMHLCGYAATAAIDLSFCHIRPLNHPITWS